MTKGYKPCEIATSLSLLSSHGRKRRKRSRGVKTDRRTDRRLNVRRQLERPECRSVVIKKRSNNVILRHDVQGSRSPQRVGQELRQTWQRVACMQVLNVLWVSLAVTRGAIEYITCPKLTLLRLDQTDTVTFACARGAVSSGTILPM
jgi:hypothetical protein